MFWILAAGAVIPAFGAEKSGYYHDDTPLSAHHSIYSDIFIHKWLDAPHDGMEPIPQAEQDKISDTFLADCRAKTNYHGLIQGLIYREKWNDILEIMPEALKFYGERSKTSKWDLAYYGECYMAWADALMGLGKKDEAKAKLEEVKAKNIDWAGYYGGGRSRYPYAPGNIPFYLHWFDEDRLDVLQMPRWNDGRAFPEAQVAEYAEKWVACPKITIVLRNIDENDARIRLLTLKLRKRGFKWKIEKGKWKKGDGYPVAIALDEHCKVQKREGYTLVASDEKTVIKGRDKQGVLWGIVSFLQILDKEKKKMRICSVEDWPVGEKRGFLGRRWGGSTEFAIFNKMDYVTIKPHILWNLAFTPLNLFEASSQGREFKEFGLSLFYDNRDITMDCAWPITWNVNLARMIEHTKVLAKCDLGLYFAFDDARYWESGAYRPEDLEGGQKPSDFDAPFIAKLYAAVKQEYPDFKMQFCPPFYWGPNAGHPYPDDRDKYLRSIAENLPKEIDIFWSGERVGSHTKTRTAVNWIRNLIGRKPSLYQNKTGAHHYQNYIVDRTRWQDWFYDGFVESMRSIQKNSATPTECPQISTLADYLWNPKAYDENRSIKRGLDNYIGKGYFEMLDSVYPLIMKYDACHKFGRVNEKSWYVELDEIEKDYVKITNVTEEVKAKYGDESINHTGAWTTAVGGVGSVLWVVRKHQGVDRRAGEWQWITNAVNDAVKYCGYNAKKGDVFLDGFSFPPVPIAYVPSHRSGRAIEGSRLIANFFAGDKGTAKFTYKKVPRKSGKIRVCCAAFSGYDQFRIVLNGNVVHEGACPKDAKSPDAGDPRHFEFEVPATFLKKGENVLEFDNTSHAWLELVYVVIQPEIRK